MAKAKAKAKAKSSAGRKKPAGDDQVRIVNPHMGGRKFVDHNGQTVRMGQTRVIPLSLHKKMAKLGLSRLCPKD